MIVVTGAPPPPARLCRVLGARVLTAVCGYYEVPRTTLLGRSRDPVLVEGRRVVIRVLWEMGLNLEEIAEATGRDRTTVGYHIGRYCEERGRRPSRDEETVMEEVRDQMQRSGAWPEDVVGWERPKRRRMRRGRRINDDDGEGQR